MKKLCFAILILLSFSSCNKKDDNENKISETSKNFIITTTPEPTTVLEKEVEVEVSDDNMVLEEKIDYTELKEMLNGLELRKTEKLKLYNSTNFNSNPLRGGGYVHKSVCMPDIRRYNADENKKYENYNLKYIFELDNFIQFGVSENNDLFFIKDNNLEFLFNYENKRLFDLIPTENKIYFLIDSKQGRGWIPTYKNFQKENYEDLTLYVYNLENNDLKQIPSESSMVLFKTKDRKICVDFNYRFWLEDNYGNKLSDYYNDFIPEINLDDYIEKFVFVKDDIYPSEFCVVNKDGSVLGTTKDHYLKFFNEDGTIKDAYDYYEAREYEVINTEDFCYVLTHDLAYPTENPGVPSQGDPRDYLRTAFSYILDKRSGKMYLTEGKLYYNFSAYKINEEIKTFMKIDNSSDLEEFKKINSDYEYLNYAVDNMRLSDNLYEVLKCGETKYFIDFAYDNYFVLYDESFNLLEKIPYLNYNDLESAEKLPSTAADEHFKLAIATFENNGIYFQNAPEIP